MAPPLEVLASDDTSLRVRAERALEVQALVRGARAARATLGPPPLRSKADLPSAPELRALSRRTVPVGLRLPRVLWSGPIGAEALTALWLEHEACSGTPVLRGRRCGEASGLRLHGGESRLWGRLLVCSPRPALPWTHPSQQLATRATHRALFVRCADGYVRAPALLRWMLGLPRARAPGAAWPDTVVALGAPCAAELRDARGRVALLVPEVPGARPSWLLRLVAWLGAMVPCGISVRFPPAGPFGARPCPRGEQYSWRGAPPREGGADGGEHDERTGSG